MKMFIAVALGVAGAAAIVACGGSAAPRTKSTGLAPVMTPGGLGGKKAEIEQLDRDIDAKLGEMNVARPAAVPPASSMDPVAMGARNLTSAQDAQCSPGPSETCTRSCTLADSICTNAARICKLADDLGEDAWARDKCANSSESCRVAHESCCSCV
jgi:hypothetical protein